MGTLFLLIEIFLEASLVMGCADMNLVTSVVGRALSKVIHQRKIHYPI